MKACIILIGSELLTPFRQDTNSLYLTGVLESMGCDVDMKIIIGDREDHISRMVHDAAAGHDLILLSGGLGPTSDDVTRDAVARFLGVPLRYRPEFLPPIQTFYGKKNIRPPDNLDRQCYFPETAEPLLNEMGTAPGFLLDRHDFALWAFPGVPMELRHMTETFLVPWLKKLDLPPVHRSTLILTGKAEAECETMLKPYYDRYGRKDFIILSGGGKIEMVVTSRDPGELKQRADVLVDIFSDDLFTCRGEGLASVLTARLIEKNTTLSVAESCTGGRLAARFTAVPGVSEIFVGGVVAYDNRIKQHVLGVPEKVLVEHGAVSMETAEAMAVGVKKRFETDLSVSVTGVAGPGGGTEEKPVGTVCMSVCDKDGLLSRRYQFHGDRDAIQTFSCQYALDLVRRRLP